MLPIAEYLADIPAGPVSDVSKIERLLAACWGELDGDHGGMTGRKLLNRMEDVDWTPPKLRFAIERHGGTVHGSTRADVQYWSIDVEENTATLVGKGIRQVRPRQRPLNVDPIAEEIAKLIVAAKEDERLTWVRRNRVRVHIGRILPEFSAVKQTLANRRKRFWEALDEKLEMQGWLRSRCYYEHCDE
jgi:hypothetical protein